MKHIYGFLLLMFGSVVSVAQLDSIPFTLDKKLLVFQGKINGENINFAFDTGAGVGVANSGSIVKAQMIAKKSKRKVVDANQEKQSLSFVEVKLLTLGSFEFKNLKDLSKDMAMLSCNGLYLLGQNVIKQLNWKIDFEKKQLYISKIAFMPEAKSEIIPIVKYRNKRPHINLKLQETDHEVLVDFGFSGIFEVNQKAKSLLTQYEAQKAQGKGNSYMSTNMGLFGFGTPKLQLDFRADSIVLGQTTIKDIPASVITNTDSKVGVGFFSSYCKSVIINYSEDKIWMLPSGMPFTKTKGYDLKIYFIENKLKVISKNLNPKSSAAAFEINEEVVSIDGKKAADFKDECDYFNWFFFKKSDTILVEKLDGQKVIIERAID